MRPNSTTRALGQALCATRRERGLSQAELAHLAGLHGSYVEEIERGERNPTWVSTTQLAAALGVTVSELAARSERGPA